ncbi:hypothetical protein DFH08DRAFT_817800 [Mycena albidolilacea]|uniref:Uncharacterized protein n=1 Tax=Mycena albidolilacea TaxID=1033008 RepID=A0AAD6ZHH3_9AGAR|nr:hypothetical protein DFH08DRAFT_817800 [Mycena albidolilacea]
MSEGTSDITRTEKESPRTLFIFAYKYITPGKIDGHITSWLISAVARKIFSFPISTPTNDELSMRREMDPGFRAYSNRLFNLRNYLLQFTSSAISLVTRHVTIIATCISGSRFEIVQLVADIRGHGRNHTSVNVEAPRVRSTAFDEFVELNVTAEGARISQEISMRAVAYDSKCSTNDRVPKGISVMFAVRRTSNEALNRLRFTKSHIMNLSGEMGRSVEESGDAFKSNGIGEKARRRRLGRVKEMVNKGKLLCQVKYGKSTRTAPQSNLQVRSKRSYQIFEVVHVRWEILKSA